MTDSVNWDFVRRGLERADNRIVWRPYGFPTITSLRSSAFADIDPLPAWDVDRDVIVQVAITGGFLRREDNPGQPITPAEILEQARACAAAGASAIHLHVRDDEGYNVLSPERFAEVIDPLRSEFPDLAIDGCLVCSKHGEWDAMKDVLEARLLDGVPINTTATYLGDALFAKPVPVILEKTRLAIEAGATPEIAVYTDGDVGNAERFLFKTGLVEQGATWIVLPALPGASPMQNPRQMIDGLLRVVRAIDDVDSEATIIVCAAGRASSYLTAVAIALGLHVRVGMEDTIWLWPHRDDLVPDNLAFYRLAATLAESMGRRVADHRRFRELTGMPVRAAK